MAKIGKIGQLIAKCIQKTVWPTKVIGAENFEKFKGGIIISNHYASTPDGAIIFNDFFKTYFNALVKEEAFRSKIGNWFLRGVGCIPVKRGEADIDAYKAVMSVLKSGENILIFPEGTRNKSGSQTMNTFKEGVAVFAMRAKVQVQPMLAEGFDRNQDKEATQFLYDKMCALRLIANQAARENGLCKK